MTQQDVERMISLADDKYIEEAFEQKIQVKKRFPIAIPFAAAAAVVCGLFFAARSAETEINDMVASEVTTVTAVTEMDEYNENLRYWKYFDGDTSEAIIYPGSDTYYRVYLPNDYTKEIANLDFAYKPHGATIYCDKYDELIHLNTSISVREDVKKNAHLSIYHIGNEKPTLPENATPETINGVAVYGFEHDKDTLQADFIIDNYGYSVMFFGIGYKEAYEITEMLIDRKLTIDEFDPTDIIEKEGIILEEAFQTEPFAKFVPRKSQFSDMPLFSASDETYEMISCTTFIDDDKPVRKYMDILYADSPSANPTKYIRLNYKWYDYAIDYHYEKDKPVYIFDLVFSMTKHFAETEKERDEINSFDFRVDCGEFIIDVEAVCTADELWECMTAIMGEATKQTSSSYMLCLAPPVDGEISAPYGNLTNTFHKGIDFKADEGTPVYAAADGVVIVPVDVDTGDEKNVIISHYTNVNTFYAHLSEVAVNEGDKVKQGDLIGYVGSTGLSTGPHLHFELCIDGEYVDPIDYFTDVTYSTNSNPSPQPAN